MPSKVRDETTIDNCQRVCTAWQANLALSSLAVSVEGGRKRGSDRQVERERESETGGRSREGRELQGSLTKHSLRKLKYGE